MKAAFRVRAGAPRTPAWLIAAALGTWTPAAARATVVEAMSVEELALEAELVVFGETSQVAARWSPDGKRIETVVELRVQQEPAGRLADATLGTATVAVGSTVRIVQEGGRIGDLGYFVLGLPEFRVGEHVVVFLRRRGVDADGVMTHAVVGMAQGKFVLRSRSDGGWDAVQDAEGRPMMSRDGRPGLAYVTVTDPPARWPPASLPVPWYLNEHGSADLGADATEVEARAAFDTWEGIECCAVAFDYRGRTALTAGDSRCGVTFSLSYDTVW